MTASYLKHTTVCSITSQPVSLTLPSCLTPLKTTSITNIQKPLDHIFHIYTNHTNIHTDPKLNKSCILKIPVWYEYQYVLFIHDYLLNKLPNSFEEIFPKNQDMLNSRETRQSNLLHVPRYSSKFAAKLPIFSLPSIWNKWSRSLPENSSKFRIKRYIKSAMLYDYSENVICENLRCVECYPVWNKLLIFVICYVIVIYIYVYSSADSCLKLRYNIWSYILLYTRGLPIRSMPALSA